MTLKTYDISPLSFPCPAQHSSLVSLCPTDVSPAGSAAGSVNKQESSEEPSLDDWRGRERHITRRLTRWPLKNLIPSMHAAANWCERVTEPQGCTDVRWRPFWFLRKMNGKTFPIPKGNRCNVHSCGELIRKTKCIKYNAGFCFFPPIINIPNLDHPLQ